MQNPDFSVKDLLGSGGGRKLDSGDGFSIEVPAHAVAAVRIAL